MADIIPFKKPKASEKHRGKTLCKNNHHRWEIQKSRPFDVKTGKLLTVFRCARCGKEKTKLM